jgi:D-alanine-D-alanine ligase
MDLDKFEVYRINITPEKWFHQGADGYEVEVDKGDFSLTINGNKIIFDAVLIGIHGTPGEDGKLQGYFDLLGLPYTSCDAATSALTMNKRYTVAVAAFSGVQVARSLHLFRHTPLAGDEILKQISLPVFVKPNSGGSSIGMSKVNHADELEAALEKAFREDEQILVEEFISGREFTIGVFKSKGNIIPLPFTEILSEKEFFDYEAKYDGKSREVTPADCDPSITEKVRQTASKVYAVFNCRGIVRMDFIYNEEKGVPFLLEINTVPGQSAASIVPQQVRANGWNLKDFYTALIEDALDHKK